MDRFLAQESINLLPIASLKHQTLFTLGDTMDFHCLKTTNWTRTDLEQKEKLQYLN